MRWSSLKKFLNITVGYQPEANIKTKFGVKHHNWQFVEPCTTAILHCLPFCNNTSVRRAVVFFVSYLRTRRRPTIFHQERPHIPKQYLCANREALAAARSKLQLKTCRLLVFLSKCTTAYLQWWLPGTLSQWPISSWLQPTTVVDAPECSFSCLLRVTRTRVLHSESTCFTGHLNKLSFPSKGCGITTHLANNSPMSMDAVFEQMADL